MKTLLFFLGILMNLSSPASALNPSQWQLVQSIPLETSLAQKDLPFTQETWVQMIDGAKSSIDMGQFYMSAKPGGGGSLEPVIAALEKAANRGVKIRILISNALLEDYPETFKRLKERPNVTGRIFNIDDLTGGILHAKYWIIDGETVFVGSQNFDWRALSHIHELGILLKDKKTAERFQKIFEYDWTFAETGKIPKSKLKTPPEEKSEEVSVVVSPPVLNPGLPSAEKALLEVIHGAQSSLQIQLLSYHPVEGKHFWPPLDNALRAASVRGVKVQLLISDWNRHHPRIDHLKSLALLPGIEVKMAFIPPHSSGDIPFARVIHSKYMIVDQKILWLGTSNWSEDYFVHSRNIDLILRNPKAADLGTRIFHTLWDSPLVKNVLEVTPIETETKGK